jgi:L-ascorbate metabolism protein UlaG (beta-lactamase superfamily)
MLIEIDGHRILTDPVWGERCSPSRFLGPKRFFAPPMPISELPALHAVVLSHDHYDHLDEFSVKQLEAQKPLYVVPLGVGAHLEGFGVAPERITELDWWQHATVGQLEVWATPARHFSGRHLWDRDATLWASYSIVGPKHRVFFSGDTGMHKDFAEIGRRLGPFDATLMETGAYDAMWADVHMGPEQAVWAHQLVQGKFFFPVHWGTFNLALHSWVEPVERMQVAALKAGVAFAVPRPGESIEPAKAAPLTPWWPKVPWRTAEESPVRSTGMVQTHRLSNSND